MKRNLILTMVHRIRYPALEPFFRSLQRTGFDGDVVVFASALSTESIRQLKDWGARVVPFLFPGEHVANRAARLWWIWKRLFASGISQSAKERLAHIVFHLFYRRHLLYLDFLRTHGSEYENVFLTDCRDVLFQADPFGWDQTPGLHVFLEEEANKLGICPHHIRWITSQFGSEMLGRWTDKTVSCAGTVFGDVLGMMDYLSRMVSRTMGVKSLRAADGDQGVHNYLVLEGVFPKITIHENRRGPVITLGPVRMSSLRFDQDDHVINETGAVVPVLHQYDRDPQLRERLLSQLDQQKIPRAV
ncbi:MAG TPA: hypothetical protein VGQ95_01350 [Chthoniobacterales bacterium]|nr:hypothetical protein [Chthoniobacterales bacterium]